MHADELAPGLTMIHGNQPEALRGLLVAWMKRHPLAPLENEVILVHSNGIAQWLKLALAENPGGEGGGCGIAAALDLQLPARFLWQAYRAVLGESAVPAASPFDKPRLTWRLMRLLPELAGLPAYAPLARFLERDDDLRKRHQLAERLADLFDQYQVYRADWLARWADGDDVLVTSRAGTRPLPEAQRWQPALWRALLADVGPGEAGASRAAVHRRFVDAAARQAAAPRPPGLPRRVMVFGISSLPSQALEVLAAVARWSQVLMFVHNPCEHYWADIVADKDLLRARHARQARKPGQPEAIADEALHLYAQPLLAAWGKQGRDFIGLLDEHDAAAGEARGETGGNGGGRIDLFASPGEDTLLHQIQDDIRDLRPLADTRARWPAIEPGADASIRFHVAHGPQREMEILHDQLLAAFDADPTLRPREVIVMVPDIDAYAPHVQAVFGRFEPQDARHIPFSVADRGLRHHDPLLVAVEALLDVPQSRLAVSDVLDLLEVPALRRRFGLPEDALPLLERWIRAANVRWGLHAEQRASLDLPLGDAQNSWSFGLRRMLLGYAVGAGEAWREIEPLDEIGGLDAALLGPLVALVDRLEHYWTVLREPRPAAEWVERLRALLADFFDPAEAEDAFTVLRLESALQAWQEACGEARLDEPLPLSVVREHWLAALDEGGLGQRFFAGAVTFATLMPMRAIPFRHVCLLGMNDGDYPRLRPPLDFDLMGGDYRPGDRSRREDDRYLFLEALLSARERLYVSWVGRSIHDNSERPPSVLVAQLRDHLAAGWRLAGAEEGGEGGQALVDALTVVHPLQPFSRAYFPPAGAATPLFTYAAEWREGLAAAAEAGAAGEAPLPPFELDRALTLRELADVLRNPVRAFFRQRLRVHFELDDPIAEDHEPFALDALQNWQLQDELIRVQAEAVARGEPREAALEARLARIARRGELAPGAGAELMRAALAAPMDDLFERYAQALAAWPVVAEDLEEVAFAVRVDGRTRDVSDWLDGVRRDAGGRRARLVLESSGLVKERRYRRDKLLRHWVAHLAGHLAGEPLSTVVVSKAGTVTLPALAPEAARENFAELVAAWDEALRRPLPLAPKSALAWIEAGGTAADGRDSRAWAAARACYEGGERAAGERDGSPYLARVFADFEALWATGEFCPWAERLLRPLCAAMAEAGRGEEA